MPEPNRPEYVNRWQISGSMQPFQIYGTYMWGFVFPAELTTLERLVDRLLNHDPSGRVAYAPFAPFVMFGFSSIDYCTAVAPPFNAIGGAYEYELAVWVPVRRRGSLLPMLFTPYIFVNNPMAVIQGREIYGFPKEMAWLRKSRWPRQFPVDAFVVENRNGRARRKWTRVVSVDRVGRAPRVPREWSSFSQAASELRARLLSTTPAAPIAAVSSLLGSIWPPHAPLVFRKQFPDCGDPSHPCYLAVVESNIEVTDLSYGYVLEDPYVLRLPPRSGHPLANDLGLRDGEPARVAYEMKLSFQIEAGREVWRADEAAAAPGSLFSQACDLAAAVPRHIVDLGVSAVQTLAASWAGPSPAPLPREPAPQPRRTKQRRRKEKVVILGGGVGALAAAFALTEAPDWRQRYDITLYQLGWRLGGKGASGRDRGHAERIEEHGIHIWFGFYENAFRVMRRCYRALLSDDEEHRLEDPILWGFEPHDLLALQRHAPDGSWQPTSIRMPPAPGWPGREDNDAPAAPHEYLTELLHWMLSGLLADDLPPALAEAAGHHPVRDELLAALRWRLEPGGGIASPHPANLLAGAVTIAASATRRREFDGRDYGAVDGVLEHARDWLREGLRPHVDANDLARRLWVLMELGAAAARGMVRDGVLLHGFDVINDKDFADWLRENGADDLALDSEWVRALYSMAFAFEDGDVGKPRAAAGVALRSLGRLLFTYRRSFAFKLRSGMGDIVFAPFYRVLKKRGVKFKFFHRVRRLHLSADGRSIDSVRLGRQATPKANYRYLRKVKNLWCWPNEPDYERLAEGRDMLALKEQPGMHVDLESAWSSWGPQHEDEVVLRAGTGFDRLVLGISLGSLEEICGELVAANPRWQAMVEKVKTVRTQAFQLWLNKPLAQTGWTRGSPVLSAFVEPIDTWADMTHTRATEDWPADRQPEQIAYFCGPMADSAQPAPYSDGKFAPAMAERTFQEMRTFLERAVHHLWPDIAGPHSFAWDALLDGDGRAGAERLRDQFWRANIDPSERYVQSLPGSVAARLRSDDSGFDNLYLAGDWTYTGLNSGCVEAATMSGLRAARAIGGWPPRIVGEEHLD